MNGPNIIMNPLLVGFVFVTNNYLREVYEAKKKIVKICMREVN